MKQIWTEEFKVNTYDVDFTHKMKLSYFFNYFQQAAAAHADDLGAGYDALRQKGMTWFLSRIILQIEKYPEIGDRLSIDTWPKGREKITALRDFIFYGTAGKTYVRGTSQWVLADIETFKLHKMEELGDDLPLNQGLFALTLAPEKLKITDPMTGCVHKIANYSEIDINGHVNNARYADWIMDCFPLEKFKTEEVSEIQINYLAQVLPGSTVTLRKSPESEKNDIVFTDGISEDSGKKHFESSVKWRKSGR
jgi:acyl-ACP thioesterase